MKKKDKNLKWYTGGEFCGKLSVRATQVAVVSYLVGLACMFIWDINERRARKNLNNK
jgi:hypothetical protein